KLPGQPDVNFKQFAGYIDVDENVVGRSLFYYFVEAEKDPLTQPLTVWLTGGPGCSSVGDAFGSVGPFIVTKDAHGLQTNLFSWSKVSNLLFIDSPIGSGWSYSNTSSDYNNGDDITNKILFTFMQKWYEKYTVLKSKDLYLAGSSFARHFVPNLANALLDDNKQSKQSNLTSKDWLANFKYNKADKDLDMLPSLKNLLRQSVPITIFSGDQDGIIPIEGTLQNLEKLAEELNIKLTKEETWSFGTKEGGLKYEFGDLLKFLTVKGGNHHVTSSRPSQAFSIFSNFTINWMH
ncbi:hypothetical protein J1N35_028603, partial [Gossypium stocksii]